MKKRTASAFFVYGVLITLLTMLLVAAFPAHGSAQVITSSLSGTVVDTSGAIIRGATITVHGPEGDVIRTIKSNNEGFFQITDLQPGTYSVSIAGTGFGVVNEVGIVITAAKDASLGRIKLAVGSVEESVTVSNATNSVDTESPNNESSLSTEELEKIKVPSGDIMESLTLLVGNVDTASGDRIAPNSNSIANIYTNGVRSNSKNVMIDGVAVMDPMSGANVSTLPSIDMVQELKLMSSNYRADSGRNAGPSVIIITKPGSQTIRGSFDVPYRNEFFNANSPDAKRLGQARAPYRLVLPSYTVTGPIRIPHLLSERNHLFFTISQQLQLQSSDPQPTVKYQTVPTAMERQGNFSQSYYGNTSGNGTFGQVSSISYCYYAPAPCTGLQIPASLQTPQGLAILNFFPLPNHVLASEGGDSYNYVSNSLVTIHRNTNLARVDWQPSSRFTIYARAMYTPETDRSAWNPGSAAGGGYSNMGFNIGNFAQRSIGVGYLVGFTDTFSSSLVNTVGLGISMRRTHNYAENPAAASGSALPATLPALFPNANPFNYLPNFGISCPYTAQTSTCTVGSPTWNDSNIASFNMDANFPNQGQSRLYSITDNLTKVIGTHSLVAGLYFEEAHVNQLATGIFSSGLNNRGSFSFNPDTGNPCDSSGGGGTGTGDPFANILLGCIDSYNQSSARPEFFGRFHNVELYAQDEWRAKPRLTLSIGMRFYHDPPAADAHNQIYDFVPSMYQASMAPRLWYPALCATSGACGNYTNNCVQGVTGPVQKGAYAIDAATGSIGSAGCRGFIVAGTSPLANPLTNGMVRAGTNGIPASIFSTPFFSYGPRVGFNWAATANGKTVLKGGFGLYYDRFPMQDQLNMLSNPPVVSIAAVDDINSFSELAGLGSGGAVSPPSVDSFPVGRHPLPTNHSFSVELQREVSRDGVLGFAYVGNVSQHLVASKNLNNEPLYAQLHSLNPQNVDPSTGNTMLSSLFLSPYRGFAGVQEQFLEGSSNYNSLQISYAQRLFHRHVQLRGNYTLSHALGNASNDNYRVASQPEPLDFYGPLSYDRRDLVNFWYIVDFPDPGRLLNSRFLSIVGRRWSASGIYRFSTGSPFTPSLYIGGVSYAGGSGPTSSSSNAITGSQDGARPVLLSASAKLKPGDSDNKFAGPAVGSWGNTGNNEFTLPSWYQFDVTLYRTFHVSERFLTTFRTEIFNVPNSTLISGLNTALQYNYSSGLAPTAGNQNQYFFTANGGGGVNGTTTNFFRPGRIIQFDLSGRF